MKYFFLFIAYFFLSMNVARSQDFSAKRRTMIDSFMNAVFRENQSPESIIKNYMYVPFNDTVSSKQRELFLGNAIDSLKKNNTKLVTSFAYKILSYTEFKGKKKLFSSSPEDIVIVAVRNKPVVYLYLNGDRIQSFTVFSKGKENYFLVI